MSTNGRDCLWSDETCNSKLQTKDIKPLTCGANHYEEWGGVGYDNPDHWCYQVRNVLGNQGDKCYTYSGYSIKFLETGETQDLSLTALPGDLNGKYACRRAAWYEPQSCNSHLTQWQMTVGCCQSYASVLDAQQEKWERKYGKRGRKHSYKYNYENPRYLLEETPEQYSEPVSEPPAKPIKVSDNYNPFYTAYEKTIVSKADTENSEGATRLEGALYAYNGLKTLTTNDIDNIDQALYSYMEFWWVKCSKLYYVKGQNAQWCASVLNFWTDVYAKLPDSLPPSVYLTPTGGCNLHDGDIIALQADTGKYVARCNGCVFSEYPDSATVHVPEVKGSPWAQWKVVTTKDGKFGLQADTGKFLSRCDNCVNGANVRQQVFVHVDALDGNPWAEWTCENVGNGKIALKSDINTYLSRYPDVENWSAADDVAVVQESTFVDTPSAQFTAKRIFVPKTLPDPSYFMRKHYTNSYESFEGTPESTVYGEKYGQRRPCYLGASPSYSEVCDSVHVDWEMNTVVPVVNAKCFPQACVLAQLAQCMDIPAPATPTGYDYVAKPESGYNGYRPSSYQRPSTYNSYTRSLLGVESSTTSYLAFGGFVAGIVVVAIAQIALQKRGKKQDVAYRMI
ncbi:hypothetical protein THRCLA_10860 [Thraustotheca clavata]|uniref:Uncharacterized protein n=1 Tax=Thraustotheca clavata TaxID=74557 RepID=A0A1V9YED4_9STRA|nr:hypothetical protein THRCLA_10860 [Thraustotheca clavata]